MSKKVLVVIVCVLAILGAGVYAYTSNTFELGTESVTASSTVVSSSTLSSNSIVQNQCAKNQGGWVEFSDPNLRPVKSLDGKPHVLYKQDDCNVYLGYGGTDMEAISGADPKSFTLISQSEFNGGIFEACTEPECMLHISISKDNKHVYARDQVLPSADPSTFTILKTPDGYDSIYGEDTNHVYSLVGNGKLLEKTNPISFKVYTPTKAEDDQNHYINGDIYVP